MSEMNQHQNMGNSRISVLAHLVCDAESGKIGSMVMRQTRISNWASLTGLPLHMTQCTEVFSPCVLSQLSQFVDKTDL